MKSSLEGVTKTITFYYWKLTENKDRYENISLYMFTIANVLRNMILWLRLPVGSVVRNADKKGALRNNAAG
jgi:hypothetical protein